MHRNLTCNISHTFCKFSRYILHFIPNYFRVRSDVYCIWYLHTGRRAQFFRLVSGRSQMIHLHATVSDAIHVDCGVPQGSVLGHKTFIAYVDEMHDIFEAHGLYHHAFADDTQTYTSVPRSQNATAAPQLQNCIAEVVDWCGARGLQLNAGKTDLLWYGSSTALQSSRYHHQKNTLSLVMPLLYLPMLQFETWGVQFDCELSICLLTLPRRHRHASSTFNVYDRFIVYLDVMLLQNSSLHLSSRGWTTATLCWLDCQSQRLHHCSAC